MLRNFTKKPNTVASASNDGGNDGETGIFGTKRGSKASTVKENARRPSSNQLVDDE